jgi:hypothetical protein
MALFREILIGKCYQKNKRDCITTKAPLKCSSKASSINKVETARLEAA